MKSIESIAGAGRLKLPTVTLCAATSINVEATLAAIRASLAQVEFAECLLFTDADVARNDPRIRVIPISPLESAEDYSRFILRALAKDVTTQHCLIIQWDGFVLDAGNWDPDFLNYDYIGARWPQFDDGFDVGNGGFSLRSRKLLQACRDERFRGGHPEDVSIGRVNRIWLERELGVLFADRATAERFAFERSRSVNGTFGFHGVFNIIETLGVDRFWQIYSSLDDRRTAFVDFWTLFGQLGSGRNAHSRRARLFWDRALALFGR